MKRRRLDDDRGERAAELGTTVVLAGILNPTLASLGEAALPPIVAWGVRIAMEARRQVATRRLKLWLSALGDAVGGRSPDDVQHLIEEGLEQQGTAELLLEAFQHLMGALNEATIPTIAKLTAEYFSNERDPDVFFRATGRFLADAEAEDLRCAERLLPRLAAYTDEATSNVRLQAGTKQSTHVVEVSIHRRDGSPESEAEAKEEVPHEFSPASVTRLFLLLKRSGLGHENASGYYGTVAGPHVVVIDAKVLNGLAKILSSPDADPP